MAETENTWRKRATLSLNCPSGNIVTVRRPGPDLALKAGKVARILQRQGQAGTDVNKQLEFIETLPDAELDKLMGFARILIADVVIQPALLLTPREGQLSPDDVPLNDFWFIFTWAMNGGPDMPVKLAEGETDIEAVRTFPEQSGSSADAGEDGGNNEGFPC